MSSTNFESILIFASCVVGTCNIPYGWVIRWEGFLFFVHYSLMMSLGIFTLGGDF